MFGFVVLFGAPYVPTLSNQQTAALKLLNLKPGQTLVELGSGDGRMLRAAAKQGIKSIGYELNPLLVIYSKLINVKYKHLINIKWANFWRHKLPACDGIYVFLLDKYMARLDKKIIQEKHSSVKLVSFAFKIPHKQPVTEESGMFLYTYPAKK
jgi:16S rRNA A1518/A1519 N6-dimethyltransferase RsmA/KsgA/DIM1 with predicted DNA glycosylase/AP lyase activity